MSIAITKLLMLLSLVYANYKKVFSKCEIKTMKQYLINITSYTFKFENIYLLYLSKTKNKVKTFYKYFKNKNTNVVVKLYKNFNKTYTSLLNLM